MEKKIDLLKNLSDTDLQFFVKRFYCILQVLGVTYENKDLVDYYSQSLLILYRVAYEEMLNRIGIDKK